MSDDVVPYAQTPTNGHKPIRRLSSLDKLFEATGEVTIRCGANMLTLPIQSVDLESVESLCKAYRPKPKVHVELVNGKRQIVENLVDGEYQEKLAEFNRLTSYAYVLCALLCDIEDAQGKVVWNADNSIHDLEGGKQALKSMGITDSQLVAILNAASNLTQVVEEQQVEG